MAIQTKNSNGKISVSNEAIIQTLSECVLECYGIAGFAKRHVITEQDNKFMEGEMLKHSIFVRIERKRVDLDIYVYVTNNIKITEVLSEVQKRAKYVLEKTFDVKISKVNVFAKGIRRIS